METIKEDKGILQDVFDQAKDLFNKVVDSTVHYIDAQAASFNKMIEDILLFISKLVWNCAVLLTFFAREIGLGILTIAGPITFGLSVLPIWKDAWSSWVTRYLSLCLYGFVAYFIMAAALQLFKYGIEVQIGRYSQPGLAWGDIFDLSSIYPLISAVVGAYGLRMVPELVTWIIPSNASMAVSHFVSGITGAASKTISTGAKMATGAIK